MFNLLLFVIVFAAGIYCGRHTLVAIAAVKNFGIIVGKLVTNIKNKFTKSPPST